MAASSDYRLGSLWLVNFDPSVGTEIRKSRSAVIISGTAFNQRSLRHSSTHIFCCSKRAFTTHCFASNSFDYQWSDYPLFYRVRRADDV